MELIDNGDDPGIHEPRILKLKSNLTAMGRFQAQQSAAYGDVLYREWLMLLLDEVQVLIMANFGGLLDYDERMKSLWNDTVQKVNAI